MSNEIDYLQNIIALLPGHIYWKDLNGVFLGCNNEQAKYIGKNSPSEVIGLTALDTLPKDFALALMEKDREIMETGVPQTQEDTLILPNGEISYWLSKKAPLRDKNNKIVGLLGTSFNITELRNAEKELKETQQKLEGMTLVAASIAHELRTPLANLNITSALIKDSFPVLVDGYKKAALHGLLDEQLSASEITALEKKPHSIQKETHAALTFIDMLLLNLNPTTDKSKIKLFSISNCIDEALARFPFTGKQSELVHWKRDEKKDFVVKGDQLLVTHILFNLLKNAIYYVLKASKGDIQIWLEPGNKYNKLLFKDTGTGIPKYEVAHVFDQFFSKTHHGAGIGLTFCQWAMENMNGQISCDSIQGEYTLFTLQFPHVKDEHHD